MHRQDRPTMMETATEDRLLGELLALLRASTARRAHPAHRALGFALPLAAGVLIGLLLGGEA